MKNIIFLFLVLSGSISYGQISFYKQFSDNGYDYAEGITQTGDSSYYITGSSSSFSDGPAQAFIMKLDSLGNFKWSKDFGGAESDGGQSIMHIENDGLLVAGFTNSSGAGAYDFYLFKTDLNGFLLWENTYGTSSWDRVYDAALTRDSGVIMVGETLNTNDGESDILIVRTDKNGNELWTQQIGNDGADLITCISAINDSTFALGGKVYHSDSLMCKAYVCKMDENGLIWWEDTLGFEGVAKFNAVCSNGAEITFVGETDHLPNDNAVIGYKCDIDGAPLINYIENAEGINKLVGIAYFGPSNRFAFANLSDNPYSYGGYDMFFSQNYPALPWELLIGTVHSQQNVYFGKLISTSDQGAIGVGNFENIGLGGSNVYVIKLMADQPILDPNTLLDFESLLSLSEIENEIALNIFPNPANSAIAVSSDYSELAQLSIQDFTGRTIYKQDFLTTADIDVSSFGSGTYFVRIDYSNLVSTTKKLVIVK